MLCENCSDLDLRAVFEGKHKDNPLPTAIGHMTSAVLISRTSDPKSFWIWQQGEGCEFCQFVQSMNRLASDTLHLPTDWQTRWLELEYRSHYSKNTGQCGSSTRTFPFLKMVCGPSKQVGRPRRGTSINSIAFGLSTAMLATELAATNPLVRELPPLIDFEILRRALRTCVDDHAQCRSRDMVKDRALSRLRVIDCSTRQVIQCTSKVDYVALSYQWGHNTNLGKISDLQLPSSLPKTIEDAILVTLGLGFKYLWVDAYCIVQDDQEDFNHQIRQMDLIYRYARLTIIAAAGTGANSSIPGVSSPRIVLQAKGYFGDLPLLTFQSRLWQVTRRSTWYTRGWTFQESFFSRRRLFFTEEQALLECDQGTVAEMLLDIQTETDVLAIYKWHEDNFDPSIYWLITDYSARDLTFPSDILNALEGIFRAFISRQPEMRSLWGLPILAVDSNKLGGFLQSLCWNRGNTDRVGRREGFPSWSWTGWLGIGWFNTELDEAEELRIPEDLEVSFGSDGQAKIPWSIFESRLQSQAIGSIDSQRLFLTGPSLRLRIRDEGGIHFLDGFDDEGLPDPTTQFGFVNLDGLFADLQPISDISRPDIRICFAIHLYSATFSRESTRSALLLVSEKNNKWERVGLLRPEFFTLSDGFKFENWLKNAPVREFCIE